MAATEALTLDVTSATWRYGSPIEIARGTRNGAEVVQVTISDASGRCGRGEAHPIDYAGEDVGSARRQIEGTRQAVETGATRDDLLELLPPGAARCALDAAIWDLDAKAVRGDPFAMAGVSARPVLSAVTIGIGSVADVERAARAYGSWPLLKLKVGGADPMAPIEAVRRIAPRARLIVDPNQSWSIDDLVTLAPRLEALDVALLEQPIPVGAERELDGHAFPIPLCADELIDDEEDLDQAMGRFSYVNVKLEKAGGLTAALRLADAATARGFGLMVGCMGGSSLSVAPAMVLAQRCAFVDLDAPLLLADDVEHGFHFSEGVVALPHNPRLWG